MHFQLFSLLYLELSLKHMFLQTKNTEICYENHLGVALKKKNYLGLEQCRRAMFVPRGKKKDKSNVVISELLEVWFRGNKHMILRLEVCRWPSFCGLEGDVMWVIKWQDSSIAPKVHMPYSIVPWLRPVFVVSWD